jgi:hypothetical protein
MFAGLPPGPESATAMSALTLLHGMGGVRLLLSLMEVPTLLARFANESICFSLQASAGIPDYWVLLAALLHVKDAASLFCVIGGLEKVLLQVGNVTEIVDWRT